MKDEPVKPLPAPHLLESLLAAASKPQERKAIMIAATPLSGSGNGYEYGSVIALCNDGTIWRCRETEKADGFIQPGAWAQLPPIPRKDHAEFELWQDGKLAMNYERADLKLTNDLAKLLDLKDDAGEPKVKPETLEVVIYSANADTGKREVARRVSAKLWLEEMK